MIDGANRVDDIFAWQIVCVRYLTLPGFTAAQCHAFLQEFRTGCTMNGSINPTTARQGPVGCVYDGATFSVVMLQALIVYHKVVNTLRI